MESGEGSSSQVCQHSERTQQRTWTREEEVVLLDVLDDIVANSGQADYGQFLSGTARQIELRLNTLLPDAALKATPHIESKIKAWKQQYSILYDMINTSNFGWNENMKCVEVDSDAAWESYVQYHPYAQGWRNKPFPLYDRLSNIWGKDRATGRTARSPAEMARDVEAEFVDFDLDTGGSPMSVNRNAVAEDMPRIRSFSSLGRKRKRSSSLSEFVGVFQRVMEKSNEILSKFVENVALANQNQSQIMVDELERLGIPFSDRIIIMRNFLRKSEDAEIFRITRNDADKLAFVQSILRDECSGN